MCYLYRGVCEKKHQANGGRLIPAGDKVDIVMRRDDHEHGVDMRRDGAFMRVPSETNTARGHQLASGIHDGCMISTTESFQAAVRFATNEGKVDGVIYVIDAAMFSSLGIKHHKFSDPCYPDEEEVSIRAADGGEIPKEIIVEVRRVSASDHMP